jgi:L-threonylcarbamoyladenylate synthase
MQIFRSFNEPDLIKLIKEGAVGVMPTDTAYCLVCSASSLQAVERLYTIKHNEYKPGTLIASDLQQLIDLGLKARYLKPVEHFWPSAISVIVPTAELEYLRQGKPGLAVRIPGDEKLRNFLTLTGALLISSATRPGNPIANTVDDAIDYFGDEPDYYVDGGDMSGHQPSTVIRVVDDAIEVLRQGAVKIDETGRVHE